VRWLPMKYFPKHFVPPLENETFITPALVPMESRSRKNLPSIGGLDSAPIALMRLGTA
jgi:hypothetical protein